MRTENFSIQNDWIIIKVKEIINEKQKSKTKVSEAGNSGDYPFFTSGEKILRSDEFFVDGPNLFMATGGVANIKYFEGKAAYSTDTYTFTSKSEYDSKYIFYYLQSNLNFINENLFSGSGLKHLQKNDFKEMEIFIPRSYSDQKKISNIFQEYDDLIFSMNNSIGKLKKIKKGIVHDLLTKGIDEEGKIRSEETHKFKDTKLGRVPEEWNISKLGNLVNQGKGFIQTGPFGSQLHAAEYVNDGIPVIMPQDIKDGEVVVNNISQTTELKAEELKRHKVKSKDIIFARRGDLSKCAVIRDTQEGWLCGTGCLLLRSSDNTINPSWFSSLYRHNVCQKQISISSVGSTMENLNTQILKDLLIFDIDINEQKEISKVIERLTNTIKSQEKLLIKFQRIKNGLMQDLLFGNIKISDLKLKDVIKS